MRIKSTTQTIIISEIKNNIRGRLLTQEPMANHTSLRVGGVANLYHYPQSREDLSKLLKFCAKRNIEVFIIGYGTNLLVSDDGFDGCVIDLSDACRELERDGNEFTVGAGVWGGDLVRFAAEIGYAGIASLAGIPGSVGGWMKMNAGAFRHTISEVTKSVEVMSSNGEISDLDNEEINYAYRRSPGLDGKIVTGAKFILSKADRSEVTAEVDKTIETRYERNVMTLPSAGSIFKNPTGYFAAKLIESLGFKGKQSGNVHISKRHANFIVNSGGGCASDVKDLIEIIKDKVNTEFNVELETEVKMLGWN